MKKVIAIMLVALSQPSNATWQPPSKESSVSADLTYLETVEAHARGEQSPWDVAGWARAGARSAMSKPLSPTVRRAIELARANGGSLIRHEGESWVRYIERGQAEKAKEVVP